MSRPATSRLKVNAPLGKLPVLQYLPPAELRIDASYQRSLDASASRALIRKIAQFWNWDLCQPLVVSRRDGSEFYVIDGQHRLAAARLRPDIGQLPCVVVEYTSSADEAASFVHLNQQRRPLNVLDVFKASVASEDPEAVAISDAIIAAGLCIAPHTNNQAWKPQMIGNISGIQKAWRERSPAATLSALKVIAKAWPDQGKRFAGSMFPGIVEVCHRSSIVHDSHDLEILTRIVASKSQDEWRILMHRKRAIDPNMKWPEASGLVFSEAWNSPAVHLAEVKKPRQNRVSVNFRADAEGMAFCDQCDHRVAAGKAMACKDRFCPMRLSGAA